MTYRHFISFPKSGRSWVRYALHKSGVAGQIAFHHDGFEYNDGTKPALDFDFTGRLTRYDKATLIVYMERNPMDVMVSLYYQVTGRFKDYFNYNGSLSEFIRDPYFGAHNLREFRLQWAKLCEEGRALHITYEECHIDFARTLKRILGYYHFDVQEEILQNAIAASTFANMRSAEEDRDVNFPWLRRRNGFSKMRKGEVNGYQTEFSNSDIQYLSNVFGT